MAVFNGFHAYDDEGYFLLTLRHYVLGRPLFTEALPVYGPIYYEVIGGTFKLLGRLPTHDLGRWLTVVVWLVSSLVGGWTAYRLTRSSMLGLGAQLVTFKALDALVNEPVQPAGLTSLLLLCLVAAATYRHARPRLTALVIGGLLAGLFLVKINVGVFASMAVALAWAASLPPRHRRWLLPLVGALVVIAPLLLTTSLRSDPSVLAFVAVLTFAAAAVFVTTWAAPPRSAPTQSTGWLVVGALLLAASSIGVALLGGTRASDMWNGLVVLAVRFPAVFARPATVSPVTGVWAFLCLAAALAAMRPTLAARISPGGAGLARLLAGGFAWFAILLVPSATYLFAVPIVWLAARSPVEDDPAGAYPRMLVPILAVTAVLQAYPVAGTQLSLGALPLVAAAAIILGDGVRQCRSAVRGGNLPLVAARLGPSVALVGDVVAVVLLAVVVRGEFASATPLALHGADSVRVPAAQATQLHGVVTAIEDNCSAFITIPGMSSFYLWTGQEPPAEVSSEVWWLVLDNTQQQAIVDRVQNLRGLCVVRNQSLIDFWALGRPVPPRPLVQFIANDFKLLSAYGDYEVLVRSTTSS